MAPVLTAAMAASMSAKAVARMRTMRGRNWRAFSSNQVPFSPRHPLVGHQDANLILLFLQQSIAFLRVGRGQNPELIAKRAREVLQRLVLVVDVEDRILAVVIEAKQKRSVE